MSHHLDVVDPHGCPVVDRAEMEEHALARGRIEPPPVPDHVADPLAYAGKLRLGAERDVDAAIEHRTVAGAELPLAVEARPRLAPEVGSRIRRSRGQQPTSRANVRFVPRIIPGS